MLATSLTTARVQILAGACEKVASDLGLDHGLCQFPLDTTYNWLVTTYPQCGRISEAKSKF